MSDWRTDVSLKQGTPDKCRWNFCRSCLLVLATARQPLSLSADGVAARRLNETGWSGWLMLVVELDDSVVSKKLTETRWSSLRFCEETIVPTSSVLVLQKARSFTCTMSLAKLSPIGAGSFMLNTNYLELFSLCRLAHNHKARRWLGYHSLACKWWFIVHLHVFTKI
jgi:hypothetical protein